MSEPFSPATQLGDFAHVAENLRPHADDLATIAPHAGTLAEYGNFPVSMLLPPGLVLPFAGVSAPRGWLFCYGQVLEAAAYPALYNAILGSFNTGGEEVGFFRLPDLRGRVIAGRDDMGGTAAGRLVANVAGGITTADGRRLGGFGGAATHKLTVDEMPRHSHTIAPPVQLLTGSSGYSVIGAGGTTTGLLASFTSYTAGSDVSHNNLQPTLVLNAIIWTGKLEN